jgi:hypothetical protein
MDDFSGFETYLARYARTAWRLRDGWISVLAIQPIVTTGEHWFKIA